MPLEIGSRAPDFTLRRQTGEKVSLEDLKGEKSMIVFIPFPFTGTCTEEACNLRDNLAVLNNSGTRVAVITTHGTATNKEWARQNNFEFDILADYWPHGVVSQMYGAFDYTHGYAKRVTYFLDSEGIVRDVVASDVLGEARDYASYPDIVASY